MFKLWKILLLGFLFMFFLLMSGCGSSSSVPVTPTVTPGPVPAPTASDFNMTLDVNERIIMVNWKNASNASNAVTARVKTQALFGIFEVNGDSLTYIKAEESNQTDTAVLEIGNGTNTTYITVSINALYWSSVSAGGRHTLAIKSDGTLWAWGSNGSGQLGIGPTPRNPPIDTPRHVRQGTYWSSVSAGSAHTLAIKSDASLWAWGRNNHGQLGIGSTDLNKTSPQYVELNTSWSSVSAGEDHSLGIKSDASLWSWGFNSNGQLGIGPNPPLYSINTPQHVELNTSWNSVSAGGFHSLGIQDNDISLSWGYNNLGQLGDGTIIERDHPLSIDSASQWRSVSAGAYHTLAIRFDGTLWAWGSNSFGQLGIGDATLIYTFIPTRVAERN